MGCNSSNTKKTSSKAMKKYLRELIVAMKESKVNEIKSKPEFDQLLEEHRIGIKKVTDYLKINPNKIPDVIHELIIEISSKENNEVICLFISYVIFDNIARFTKKNSTRKIADNYLQLMTYSFDLFINLMENENTLHECKEFRLYLLCQSLSNFAKLTLDFNDDIRAEKLLKLLEKEIIIINFASLKVEVNDLKNVKGFILTLTGLYKFLLKCSTMVIQSNNSNLEKLSKECFIWYLENSEPELLELKTEMDEIKELMIHLVVFSMRISELSETVEFSINYRRILFMRLTSRFLKKKNGKILILIYSSMMF